MVYFFFLFLLLCNLLPFSGPKQRSVRQDLVPASSPPPALLSKMQRMQPWDALPWVLGSL